MTRRTLLGSLAFAMTPLAARPALRRKDCFFGLHFDLHPNEKDKDLGRHLTIERARELVNRVRPDYVQYDCKGHAGYLGFVSPNVGTPSPGIVNDSLAIWRKATEERGIGLFVHFSGVWDSLAVKQHPEWARVKPDGTPDDRQTSVFGPYVDQLMLPQLMEAARKYNLDGAWVDGECWATNPDYSAAAAAAFGKPLPKKPEDPYWQEFLEFNRERFRAYVKHYVDAMHAKFPNFQIASNWLYTTFVPEKPTLPIDFVSGDYLGNASIATARYESRYLSSAGVPWDLMAWGFQSGSNPIGHVHKPPVQLQQEASVVLAQGGGFQVYYQPTRAGYFDDRLIGVMEQVAKFCRLHQETCHKSATVPQVGVLFSGYSLYHTSNKLFGGWPAPLLAPIKGWISALAENHLSADVIPDWKLEMLNDYPLIIVPEWLDIGDRVAEALRGHKGKILFCGVENARRFARELGIKVGEAREQPAFLPSKDLFANAKGIWLDVEASSVWEKRHPTYDFSRDGVCAASGDAQRGGIYGPVGTVFNATHAPAARDFINRVVRRLFTPMVEVEAPAAVEFVLRRKSGKLYAHLLNASGMQVAGDYAAFDEVPAVGPVKLRMGSREKVLERINLYEIVTLEG